MDKDDGTSDFDLQRFEDVESLRRIQTHIIHSDAKVAPEFIAVALHQTPNRIQDARRRVDEGIIVLQRYLIFVVEHF